MIIKKIKNKKNNEINQLLYLIPPSQKALQFFFLILNLFNINMKIERLYLQIISQRSENKCFRNSLKPN